MRRRSFLLSACALGMGAASQSASRPRIRAVTLTPIQGRFHKFVAMNSHGQPNGHTYTNTLVRIETNQGVVGIGVMAYRRPDEAFQQAARGLIGLDPFSLYEMKDARIVGRATAHAALLESYKHLDGPLFDLIGKIQGVPCWRLIGESVREKVEAYDGTIYFSDVWFSDRGLQAVAEEAEEAAKKGYRGIKMKVGRGWKWMPRQDGLTRDIEAVKAVRDAVGKATTLRADANNGFKADFEDAWRLLEETREADLYWMEEIFPEEPAKYARLRQRLKKAGMTTLIADGESVRDPAAFEPYLQPERVMDRLQMDIRVGGFVSGMEVAALAEGAGAKSVPHNWGSQVGLFMSLHLAKATRSVEGVEDDRSTCDAIVAEGYRFEKGFYTVSDEPGLGIHLNERVYEQKYKDQETRLD